MSVVEVFSGIDVDDMWQSCCCCFFRFLFVCFFDMLLLMCSIWACHRNLLSAMRPSGRCSVTFSVF